MDDISEFIDSESLSLFSGYSTLFISIFIESSTIKDELYGVYRYKKGWEFIDLCL